MRRLLTLLSLTVLLAACAGTDADGVPVTNPAQGFGDDVAAVSCDGGGHDAAYHIHSQLVIYLPDGTSTDVPANIGIGDRCMYWVHTHPADGVIHVEAPNETTATLADFLEIWRRTSNPTIPDAVFAGTAQIKVIGEPVANASDVILSEGIGIEIFVSSYPTR
jgi:hypothetical protein